MNKLFRLFFCLCFIALISVACAKNEETADNTIDPSVMDPSAQATASGLSTTATTGNEAEIVSTPTSSSNSQETVASLSDMTLLFNDFESGWGDFLDGGHSASIITSPSYSGLSAIALQGDFDNQSSMVLRQPLDLTTTDTLTWSFWLYAQNLEDTDKLTLEYSDGITWYTVKTLQKGVDFGNDQFNQQTVNLTSKAYNFSPSGRLKLTSQTRKGAFYVDDVLVTARIDDNRANNTATSGRAISENYSFTHEGVTSGCAGCHNNVIAEGKATSHIDTTNACEQCHIANNPEGWLAITYTGGSFDHTGVSESCVDCHNDQFGRGKSAFHIESSNRCEHCHKPDITWQLLSEGFSHQGLVAACVDCHDGAIKQGKGENHIPSSNDCQNCHQPEAGWILVEAFDHSGIVDDCVSCHDGVRATGKDLNHIPSGNSCEQCHSPDNGWWLEGLDAFDHSGITQSCVTCHNNTVVQGKPSNHLPTSDDCQNCHTSSGKWQEVEVFNHEGIQDNCVSCHNGNEARGKSEFHIPSSNNCETCHGPDSGWLLVVKTPFEHEGITGACVACHNNTVSLGKPENHIPSGDQCEQCHQIGSWSLEQFQHEGIVDGCSNCHDGVTATGQSSEHIPSSQHCEFCHTPNTDWAITINQSPFSHLGITEGCISCHNNVTAKGKSDSHVPASNDCQLCHNTTTPWEDTKFNHEGITTGCFACHNGTITQGKTSGHIPSSNQCETCHTPGNNWILDVQPGFNHRDITSNCASCHDGQVATGKSANHIPSGNNCENCHAILIPWNTAQFSHDGITGGCATCHNGTIATGQSPIHFDTRQSCETCHQPTTWLDINFVHSTDRYPGDHRFGLACRLCHTTGSEVIPWRFPDYEPDCAGCHANDYEPGEHRNAPVGELKNCAGTCHINRPRHSVNDSEF